MLGNTATLNIEVAVDADGSIKVLRQIGNEIDKSAKTGEKSFKRMNRTLGNFNRTAINVYRNVGALAGAYGLMRLSGSFLAAATESENFRVRLNTTLGSIEEGGRLFQEMSDYAASVPFQYNEIMSAATSLTGVMKGGVDEIAVWMPMIGDLAAVAGLSIEETTAQVIRMYSGGAGAADLFRDQGVLAMMDFEAGVSYSVEETKRKMFAAWNAVDSKFKGITNDLAQTWTGVMSMFGDRWFQFRNMVMDAGPFDILKEGAIEALQHIQNLQEEGRLDIWAYTMATGVIEAIRLMIDVFSIFNTIIAETKVAFGGTVEWISSIRIRALTQDIDDAWTKISKLSIKLNDPIKLDIKTGEYTGNNSAIKRQFELIDEYQKKLDFWKTALKGAVMQVDDQNDSMARLDEILASANKKLDEYINLMGKPKGTLGSGVGGIAGESSGGNGGNAPAALAARQEAAEDATEAVIGSAKVAQDAWMEASRAMSNSFQVFFVDAITGQLDDLGDYILSFLNQIGYAMSSMFADQGADLLTGFAKSLVPSPTSPVAPPSARPRHLYAAGGWITEPVVGRGVRSGDEYSIAEREPELVLPPGRLGGGDTTVNVQVINNTKEEATVSQEEGPDGQMLMRIVIGQVADDIRSGGAAGKAIEQTYGIRRRGAII